MTKDMLPDLLYDVVQGRGGRGAIVPVCKKILGKA